MGLFRKKAETPEAPFRRETAALALAVLDRAGVDGEMLAALTAAGLTAEHGAALLRLGDGTARRAALVEMAYRAIPPEAAEKYIDALLRHGETPSGVAAGGAGGTYADPHPGQLAAGNLREKSV